MAKDYAKLCPKLSKQIPQETVDADLVVPEVVEAKAPTLTKSKVEQVYSMLKANENVSKIVAETGLWRVQVDEIFHELNAYKNYTEPVVEEGE